MERRLLLRAAPFALTAAMSLGGIGLASAADDEASIRQMTKTFASAWAARDAKTWLSLWDENSIQMPPGRPARDKRTMDVEVPKEFAAVPAKSMTVTPDEIVVAGDWAWARGTIASDVVVKGSDVHHEVKYVNIYKRQADGSWKIYRAIYNSNGR